MSTLPDLPFGVASGHDLATDACVAGLATLAGPPLEAFERIENRLRVMGRQAGAQEIRFPSLISRAVLERAGHFDAFPGVATEVASGGTPATHALSPAVCYHAYARLEGMCLEDPVLVSCGGRCHRREAEGYAGLARLWEFTMREIVFVGDRAWVVRERERWSRELLTLAAELGLPARLEPATDPFFGGPDARGRRLLQQVKALKLELRVDAAGGPLAIASSNLHETFFGTRFGITLADGSPAWSGCVAFGLERWVHALLTAAGDRADIPR